MKNKHENHTSFTGSQTEDDLVLLTHPSFWKNRNVNDEYCQILEHFKSFDIPALVSEFKEKNYDTLIFKRKKINSNITFDYNVRAEQGVVRRGYKLPFISHELHITYSLDDDVPENRQVLYAQHYFNLEDLK